ncbi:transglycosylase SLT domain-containing protein [Saccharibacter sp. EH611]|uniref:transglycosylase SLT domain-containing protein n=1 Tax=Saccharibacter sp. EH611 TaxID=2689391 RepID=UPI00132596BA|nr:transglycosylase SLT domain-containing protein [Saccharibacter sp. EH611]MXV35873.1 transglycosylase SLT domain-containing protein [Saccharibacter sp. EH611]
MPQVPYTDDTYKLPERVSAGGTELLNVPNYGEMVGRGLDRFGSGIAAANDVAERLQRQDDITAVQGAMNDFRTHVRNVQYGDPNNPNDTGFFGLQNKATLDAWKPTAQGLDQTRRSLMDGLTSDQQRLFQQESEPFLNSALDSMSSHTAQQRKSYQQQTQKATLENLVNQGAANHDNPSVFSGTLLQGRNAIAQNLALRGVPSDSPIAQQELQKFNDDYFTTSAQAATDSGDAIKAQNLLMSNRRNLSEPVFEQSMAMLKPHIDHQVGGMLADAAINHRDDGMAIPAQSTQDAVFTTMTHLESGGQQTDKNGNPLTSPKGATGIAQLMPDTARSVAQSSGLGWDEDRFKHDSAYNRALGAAYYSQLCQKYGGNLTLACAAYNAGPGHVNQWLKDIGDPRSGAITDQQFAQNIPFKETRDYVSRAGAALTKSQPAPSYEAPDREKQLASIAARGRAIGASPEAIADANSRVEHNYSIWNASTQGSRNQLGQHLDDLSASYMAGNTQTDIPERDIRTLYPPEEAQNKIDDLNDRRRAGLSFNAIKWASPQQAANVLKGATTPLQGEDIDHFRTRQKAADLLLASLNKRQDALKKDPASYVQDNPQVQQAWQDYQQNETPETFKTYAKASQALQQTMGVSSPHVLTSDEADHLVTQFTQADPQKQEVGPALDNLRHHYGDDYWPQVLSEMVAHKLPADYATMANMDTPAQQTRRQMLQRDIKIGEDKLKVMAGPDAAKLDNTTADNPLYNSLGDARKTFLLQAGGDIPYQNLAQTMKLQTLGYMAKGLPLSQAMTNARADLFDMKYDTSGFLRTPKGEMSVTKQTGAAMLSSLRNGDIREVLPDAIAKMPPQERERYNADSNGTTLTNARDNGQWVMNDKEDGYNLLIPSSTTPGEYQMLQDKKGQPITLSIKDIHSGKWFSPYDTTAQRDARLAHEGKPRHIGGDW